MAAVVEPGLQGIAPSRKLAPQKPVKHMQELAALDDVYGGGAGRSAEGPLLIGSVKSNMGHCEGCSGLAGTPRACRTSSATQGAWPPLNRFSQKCA